MKMSAGGEVACNMDASIDCQHDLAETTSRFFFRLDANELKL